MAPAFNGFTFSYLLSNAFCPVGGVILLLKTKSKQKITVFRVYLMFSGKEFFIIKESSFFNFKVFWGFCFIFFIHTKNRPL